MSGRGGSGVLEGTGAAGVRGEAGRWKRFVAPGCPTVPQHLSASISRCLPPAVSLSLLRQMLGEETVLVFGFAFFPCEVAELTAISHLLGGNHLGD